MLDFVIQTVKILMMLSKHRKTGQQGNGALGLVGRLVSPRRQVLSRGIEVRRIRPNGGKRVFQTKHKMSF
jgi:hypothetical protein